MRRKDAKERKEFICFLCTSWHLCGCFWVVNITRQSFQARLPNRQLISVIAKIMANSSHAIALA